jgi:acetolactate synthase-1/2/3 large subunit
MKASDYVARFLAAQGVGQVFEVIGGTIAHLVDSLYRDGRIEIVSMRHEQAAAFAADATGRLTGVPGVALATSGPGATNLLTGIGSCYFDSSPAVFLTGQVNRHEQRGERPTRQLGFQETDVVAMAAPITKAALRVESPRELPAKLAHAFDLAREGRPGPVLVDLPMDVQGADIDARRAPSPTAVERAMPAAGAVDAVLAALRASRRPLLLAGGGVRASGAVPALRAFARATGMPVVHSLLAVDALASEDPLKVGLIGSYGNRWANVGVGEADLLLVVGSRLDIRQTGADVDFFKGQRTIFHVDIDAGEINGRVRGCEAVQADARAFLEAATVAARGTHTGDFSTWREEIAASRARWPDIGELPDVEGINPNVLMHELSRACSAARTYVVDVGQHQQWAAQSLELGAHQRFITSGGMGAMGFALPAAVGAAYADPTGPVVVIAGDGGFQLNLQELQTVAHSSLPLKILVVDNGCHGMVRQFQQSYFGGRYQSTLWGYSAPAFDAVADAYGIESVRVTDPGELGGGLVRLMADPARPFLLHVMIDPLANVYPKLAFGKPLTEMEPLAKPIPLRAAGAD